MLAKQRGAEMIEELSKIDGVDSVRGLGLLLAVEIEKESLANGDCPRPCTSLFKRRV